MLATRIAHSTAGSYYLLQNLQRLKAWTAKPAADRNSKKYDPADDAIPGIGHTGRSGAMTRGKHDSMQAQL
jgi:hypothetical protein